MKKYINAILLVILSVIVFSLVFSGCSRHEHSFRYAYDDNNHWQECECGEELEPEAHNYQVFEENNILQEKCVVCGKTKPKTSTTDNKEITDSATINGIMSIDLDYEFFVPDMQLSYNYLWDGYDLENKFGPNISKREFNTYLTEYKQADNKFYLVYINNDAFGSYKEKLKSYEQLIDNPNNYHFSSCDNEKIIDGKYFYCFQTLNGKIDENVKFFETDCLEKIKFKIDNYQLVLCARSKKAVIKENLSTSKSLNKEITIYSRYELEFKNTDSYPTYYEFDLPEKSNQNRINEMFDYVGEMIEAFPTTYESLEYTCFPTLGLGDYRLCLNIRAEVVIKDGEKYVLLPRYEILGEETLDLLNPETDLFWVEDVFREHKSEFLEALVFETDIVESFHMMALYDYDKVVNIIKIK